MEKFNFSFGYIRHLRRHGPNLAQVARFTSLRALKPGGIPKLIFIHSKVVRAVRMGRYPRNLGDLIRTLRHNPEQLKYAAIFAYSIFMWFAFMWFMEYKMPDKFRKDLVKHRAAVTCSGSEVSALIRDSICNR